MRALQVLIAIAGAMAIVVGVLLLLTGGLLKWADASETDRAGYFTSARAEFATSTAVIVTDGLDFDVAGAPDILVGDRVRMLRIRARSEKPGTAVFIGIGPRDRVQAYLGGAARDVIERLDWDPLRPRLRRTGGQGRIAPPASQGFWVAQVEGVVPRPLVWRAADGEWDVVAMNADGSAGVALSADLGVRVGFLGWVSVAMMIIGAILIVIGIVVVRAARTRRRAEKAPPGPVDVRA